MGVVHLFGVVVGNVADCLKCGGLSLVERVTDFFHPTTVLRCLMCGWVGDRQILVNRAASREKGFTVPKFLSEEHKQCWVEAVRRTKQAKKLAALASDVEELDEASESRPELAVSVVPTPAPIRPAGMKDACAVLDVMIGVLADERRILEQAKAILSRGRI